MKVAPRPYQQTAIQAALKGLRGRSHQALVVLATGLGKTLTAAFITKELRVRRILFLVHNNFILDHAVDEFRLVFDEDTEMAVYNGLSKEGAENARIVFATWQTMGRNLKRWSSDHFDLIIVDEAHHTEAETYRPVVQYFTGAKLGITATPDRADEADIRSIFGPEVADVALEEAIARGWLPRIEYHVVTDESLDEDALQEIAAEIREARKRFTMAEVNRRIFIRKRDEEIARIIDSHKEKSVVFCASIKHAGRMNRALRSSAVFHSETGNGQRDTWAKNQAALRGLRTGIIRRICAVNAFNEGVNVPDVGLVAFCRVTNAPTIFRQQLGRGLRPGKDKLIVLDFVGNLERIQLVMAMMNEIADLHEEFTPKGEQQREGYERQKFEVSGAGFEFTFSDRVVDLMSVLEHIERDFYPTWHEASSAALVLGLSSESEYVERYREDSRLPSNPSRFYVDFPSWPQFWGRQDKKFYTTWQEASRAVRRLGFNSEKPYKEKYREDPRLPSNPNAFYPNFPGWTKFFGREEKNLYSTWQEASRAVIALGIQNQRDYRAAYHKDPKLPGVPHQKYEDYPGDLVFYGREKYKTWREASRAAIGLGFTLRKEYESGFSVDPRLPAKPRTFYKDYPGDPIFFGREKKSLYSTWQQASKAAIALGFTTMSEYEEGRSQDSRLPADPHQAYPNYPGAAVFLSRNKK